MAGLTIGMSLDQARRNLKGVLFERTSDGDGAALVTVRFATGPSIVIFAGEDDPDTAIDWSRPIQVIETFDAYFVTADGVRVGSLVADLIPRLGAVREIVKSEIESREYITFERHPARLTLRIDYTGEFGASNHTTRYKPTARIIRLPSPPSDGATAVHDNAHDERPAGGGACIDAVSEALARRGLLSRRRLRQRRLRRQSAVRLPVPEARRRRRAAPARDAAPGLAGAADCRLRFLATSSLASRRRTSRGISAGIP